MHFSQTNRTASRCAGAMALLALCAASAQAADFTVAPNITGGFGNYHWDIAIGSAGVAANPALTLYTGVTYTFQVNTSAIHPFWIKTSPSIGSANAYTGGGLSANGVTTATAVTFTVPANAPSTLYYDCGNHIEMHGTINVIVDPIFKGDFES